ncbi:hypothetical protein [Phenylobacterium sp.]|uniref:hypothetical protein n=1 Tax=Phenylobacterium sp. TaxID=1871053 RepID=UPI0025F06D90|nr:hypothetical protein [Phenylobacterium sp.]
MSIGLSQPDATTRVSAFAVAQRARANADQARAAAVRMRAEAARTVPSARRIVESPADIRAEVMADRGVNPVTLLRLGPQSRIEAEISIDAETATRARQAQIRTTGNFLDLTV